MTFVTKCLSEGSKEKKETKRGNEEGEKEGKKGKSLPIPFVKDLRDQEPQKAIKQYVPLYLL